MGRLMRRSQLETYLDILEVLVVKPLEFAIILCQIDTDPHALETYLEFLLARGLVERLHLGKKRFVYVITDRGLTVLDTLRTSEQAAREELLWMPEE